MKVGLAGQDVTANVGGLEVQSCQEALLPELRNYLPLLVAAFELVERTECELLRRCVSWSGTKTASCGRSLAPCEGI